jgi:hypothetical protein
MTKLQMFCKCKRSKATFTSVDEDMCVWNELDYCIDICDVDLLCGLVVKVLGYRSGGPGSILGTTRKKKSSSGSGTGSTQPREYN